MCLKSYFKEIVLKLATNGQSDKGFLLASAFVPKGLSALALGLYTCIKALKYTGDSRYVDFAYLDTITYVEVIFHSQHFFSINICLLNSVENS